MGPAEEQRTDAEAMLEELRALPRLLASSASRWSCSQPPCPSPQRSSLNWHRHAGSNLMLRVKAALQNVSVRTLPTRVRHVRAMVHHFDAELGRKLSQGAHTLHGAAVQQIVGKVEELLSRSAVQRGHAEKAKDQPVVMPQASAYAHADTFAELGLGAASVWNSLFDSMLRAHEKHNILVEFRLRALDDMDAALTKAKGFTGCGADPQELHEAWFQAMRSDSVTNDALLEAWAAMVSAQERLLAAVEEQGLPRLLLMETKLTSPGRDLLKAGDCQDFGALVEQAHSWALARVDRALWPLTEQVLGLVRLAGYQQRELRARKLRVMPMLPIEGVVDQLRELATAAADPRSQEGLELAARALDAAGAQLCPAPPGCASRGGMLVGNFSQYRLFTSRHPGDLLLGKVASDVVEHCSPVGTSSTILASVLDAGHAKESSSGEENRPSPADRFCDEMCAEHFRVALRPRESWVGAFLEVVATM